MCATNRENGVFILREACGDADDAVVLINPFDVSNYGAGYPLTSFDNPNGEWSIDCYIQTPLPPTDQWHTLVRGLRGDSQILVAPDQDSEWQHATYEADVGSLTSDWDFDGDVTNWSEQDSPPIAPYLGTGYLHCMLAVLLPLRNRGSRIL